MNSKPIITILLIQFIFFANCFEPATYKCYGSNCNCVDKCVYEITEHITPMQRKLNNDAIVHGCHMKCNGSPCKSECILNGGNMHNCFHICGNTP